MTDKEKQEKIELEVERNFDKYLDEVRFSSASQYETMKADEGHIKAIGQSVLQTLWKVGPPGGSFVQAIVDNDLTRAFGSADRTNKKVIEFYVKLKYNASLL